LTAPAAVLTLQRTSGVLKSANSNAYDPRETEIAFGGRTAIGRAAAIWVEVVYLLEVGLNNFRGLRRNHRWVAILSSGGNLLADPPSLSGRRRTGRQSAVGRNNDVTLLPAGNTLYELDQRDEAVIAEQYRISERIA